MTKRQQFEAWWLKDVPENHRDFAKKLLTKYGQDYAEAPGVADAWTTWQASRLAALEEAAKTVGALHEKISAQEIIGFDAWSAGHLALDNAACHIVALANGETNGRVD